MKLSVLVFVCLLHVTLGGHCDEVVDDTSGQISLPSYEANQTCVYTFNTDKQLYLTIQDVTLSNNASLVFYNGSQEHQVIYLVNTNADVKSTPVLISSVAPNTTVVFHTGNAANEEPQSNFTVSYDTNCTLSTTSGAGVLHPPYFLDAHGSVQCEYSVSSADTSRKLVMSFEHEQLQKGYLHVYDGGDSKTGTLVVNVTGTSAQTADIISECNNFTLDFVLSTTKAQQGFTAAYALLSPECTQVVTIQDFTDPVSITSHGYPGNYSNNLNCRYIVTAPADARIHFQITDLDLADAFDTITFNDGGSKASHIIGQAIERNVDYFMTSGNALWVQFVTDEVNVAKGFSITLRATKYGGFYETMGEFDLKMDNSTLTQTTAETNVYYQLRTLPSMRLVVSLNDDALIHPSSVLEFHEGLSENDPIITTLTTSTPFYEVASRFSQMLIVAKGFLTNGTLHQQHFTAKFHSEVQDNTRQYSVGEGGSNQVMSSDVTNGSTWHIHNKNNSLVALSIDKLVITEGHALSVCRGLSDKSQNVLQFNTTPEYVPALYVRGDVKVCYKKVSNISSEKNDTDSVVFSASYRLVPECVYNLNGSNGTFTSPSFPDRYPYNAQCDWAMSTKNQQLVHITFQQFDLALGHSVTITTSKNDTWQLGANYTGNQTPDDFISSSDMDATTVTFSSLYNGVEHKNVGQGFQAQYTIIDCGGNVTHDSGSISTPGYPGPIANTTTCVWLVQVPQTEDKKTTNIIAFDYEIRDQDKKYKAAVEFKDGGSSLASPIDVKAKNGKVKGKLSRYNVMLVKYTYAWSDLDSSRGGFSFKLDFKTHTCKELCDNGVCMLKDWKCDFVDQCGDGSDEKDCSSIIHTKYKVKGWVIFVTMLVTFIVATAIACVAPYVYKRVRYSNYNELRDLMAPVPT